MKRYDAISDVREQLSRRCSMACKVWTLVCTWAPAMIALEVLMSLDVAVVVTIS